MKNHLVSAVICELAETFNINEIWKHAGRSQNEQNSSSIRDREKLDLEACRDVANQAIWLRHSINK